MREIIMNERNEAVATRDVLLLNVVEPMDDVTTDDFDMNIEESTPEGNADIFETDGGGEDSGSDSIGVDVDDVETSDEITEEEDFLNESMDDYSEEELGMESELEDGYFEGDYMDSSYDEGMYMDPGYDEGMYMDPGMEMGMEVVKDPLLSSWPFVIGISATVLVVSIVIGALLAKLRIKKGIDLYED